MKVELENVKPMDIEKRSFEIITEELGDKKLVPGTELIVKRCIHTSADFDYAENLCFSENAVEKAIAAIKDGACIVTDTHMAESGINKRVLSRYGGEVFCFISDEDVAATAKANGTTRATASMDKAAAMGKKLIFAIGNAPTALVRLYELIEDGKLDPELIIGVPVGVLTSVFMARFCPEGLYKLLKPVVNLLAGIPSIVYGFFGLVVLVPFIREHFKNSNGQSILCASILLGIMILPTIIGASEPTIRAVEQSYYEGALALGATHERSVFTVVVPAAKSGILAAVILGVGRALGETMAVMMVVGNQPRVPNSILQGVRTLTTNIVMEMGYATDLHREALIATGVVLFAFILIINLCFSAIKRSGKE